MNPLMEAEEFFWNAYKHTNTAGTQSAQSELTDEAHGRMGVGSSNIIKYQRPSIDPVPMWRKYA